GALVVQPAQRDAGSAHQLLGPAPGDRQLRDTDRRGERDSDVADVVRLGQFGIDLFREGLDVDWDVDWYIDVIRGLQENRVLVGAEPGHHSRPVAAHAFQPAGDDVYQLVTCAVPQAVLDRGKAVQIQVQQCDDGRRLQPCEHFLQVSEEELPVRQAGLQVVERLVLQALLEQLQVGDVIDHRYEVSGLGVGIGQH